MRVFRKIVGCVYKIIIYNKLCNLKMKLNETS